MSKLRVFEAFAGVGTQSMALKRLGVDYEVVGIAEIDKFAIQSYMAIHGEIKNYGDISKIDPAELPDMDLFTYSFPCQDLSISGKQRGMGEGTRSGLLYECEKVITTKKPKYLLLENVKNLVGKKFKPDFDKWLEWLESQGYSNYWQVLNAKDYGVPQNRERVFVVSILGKGTYEFAPKTGLQLNIEDVLEDVVDDKFYLNSPPMVNTDFTGKAILRKERTEYGKQIRKQYEAGEISERRSNMTELKPRVDGISNTLTTVQKDNLLYEFPEPFPLEVKLKDILEDEVEEKHYLSSERAEKLMLTEKDNIRFEKNRIIQVTNPTFSQQRVYHSEGIAPTIAAGNNGGGKEPCKIIDYVDGEVRVKEATIVAMRGRYNSEGKIEQQLEPRKDGLTNTITTVTKDNLVTEPPEYRIRRLTPLECWRLMGIADEDFYKAKAAGTSDSQLYKQAGNAIVVDVLVGIFGNLFGQEYYLGHTDEIDLNDYTFVYANEVEQQQWRL